MVGAGSAGDVRFDRIKMNCQGGKKAMKKRLLAALLCGVMMTGMLPTAFAADITVDDTQITTVSTEDEAATSGTCGENLTWTLDDAGTLTISGTGEMTDWSEGDAPWYKNRTKITTVVIGSGVTSVGSYAFYGCTNLTDVTIPEGVESIGQNAFENARI